MRASTSAPLLAVSLALAACAPDASRNASVPLDAMAPNDASVPFDGMASSDASPPFDGPSSPDGMADPDASVPFDGMAPIDASVPFDGMASSDASVPFVDGGGSRSALSTLVPRALFESMFLHRATAPCRGAFYTYEAFLAAAETFPAFAAEGDDATRRREVAAFLANIGHETTGGWPTAPDGPYAWGLCWITEGATVEPSALPDYCAPSAAWPCTPGEKYFGRGPIQLSWNYNYGQCGEALALPLLADPGLVARDPVVAFRSALWFWMTPQAPKPSCHDVMSGRYVPSAADLDAGRVVGFGLTINIINGGLECGRGDDARVRDRIGYYERFTALLGTEPGPNLDCGAMRAY